jgi:hypothetical protein
MTMAPGALARVEAPSPSDVLERIIIHGDLKALDQTQKVEYYRLMCESLGLNANTRPFAYLVLNGKTVLYALRDCTDQLRRIHKVSVVESTQEEINGVYIVVCKVQNGEGRTDIARGAVDLGVLKGEALANAIMKAETKAKRRATLSICGLGVLDETEIEDMQASKPDKNGRVKGRDLAGRKTAYAAKRDGTDDVFNDIRRQIANAPECEILAQISDSYSQELADLPARYMLILSEEYEDKWQDLGGDVEDSPVRARREPG